MSIAKLPKFRFQVQKGRKLKGNEKKIDKNDDRCALRHKATETET